MGRKRRKKNLYFPMECFYCATMIPNRWHHSFDHVTALAGGGSDGMENLVDCCRSCNKSKADLTLAQWLELVRENHKSYHVNHPAHQRTATLILRLEYVLSDDDRPSPWGNDYTPMDWT